MNDGAPFRLLNFPNFVRAGLKAIVAEDDLSPQPARAFDLQGIAGAHHDNLGRDGQGAAGIGGSLGKIAGTGSHDSLFALLAG
ncbi:hypothetical protein D3C83_83650 [compost metagenome]